MNNPFLQKTKEALEKLLPLIGFSEAVVDVSESPVGGIDAKILLADGAGALIGERGQGLAALEYLVRRMVLKGVTPPAPLILLDVNGYRAERARLLRQRAREAADEVRARKEPFQFEPMSPAERRVIHLELAARGDVVTESQGESSERRVVIRPYP